MLSIAIAVCVVGIPLTVVGLLVLIHLRANDRRAADRHDRMLAFFASEVLVPSSPDSTRRSPLQTGAYPVTPRRALELTSTQRSAVVAALAPLGAPITAECAAEAIGRNLVAHDFPDDHPGVLVLRDAVLCRPGAERAALEAIVQTYATETGLAVSDVDVRAIVAALTRPAIVRTAPQ